MTAVVYNAAGEFREPIIPAYRCVAVARYSDGRNTSLNIAFDRPVLASIVTVRLVSG